jgi:cytochrome c oxidase cbb3-type subunit 4
MDFDINTLRSAATVVSFVTFIGIVWWAWSRRRTDDFSQAAQLPFEQD